MESYNTSTNQYVSQYRVPWTSTAARICARGIHRVQATRLAHSRSPPPACRWSLQFATHRSPNTQQRNMTHTNANTTKTNSLFHLPTPGSHSFQMTPKVTTPNGPKFERAKHIAFFQMHLKCLPAAYKSLVTNTPRLCSCLAPLLATRRTPAD
jgi:hypothetical protein